MPARLGRGPSLELSPPASLLLEAEEPAAAVGTAKLPAAGASAGSAACPG
jgi:hypothetical protein